MKKRVAGVTLIEIIIVTIVSSIILGSTYLMVRQWGRTAMWGMDTLESTRAAGTLFSQIRRDFLGCRKFQVGAGVRISHTAVSAPAPSSTANSVVLDIGTATVTYELTDGGDEGKSIVRKVEALGNPPTIRLCQHRFETDPF